MEFTIPDPPSDCGRRLLPTLVDEIANTDPERPFISVPRSLDLRDGFVDITYSTFAKAINRCSWAIERVIGRSQDLKTLLYIGPLDIRYLIILLAAVKTGHKVGRSWSAFLNANRPHPGVLQLLSQQPQGTPLPSRCHAVPYHLTPSGSSCGHERDYDQETDASHVYTGYRILPPK